VAEAPCATVTDAGVAASENVAVEVTVSAMRADSVKLPDVPIILTLAVPTAAVALATRLRDSMLAVVPRVKVAVTPEGRPETARVTVPLKPFTGLRVMVDFAEFPWTRPMVAGLAVIVKLDGDVTATLSVKVLVRVPDFPVTVTVAAPKAAEADAVSVRTLDVVAVAELKDAVTPEGKPETVNATLPENPFSAVMATVLVALPPWRTDTEAGVPETEMEAVADAPVN